MGTDEKSIQIPGSSPPKPVENSSHSLDEMSFEPIISTPNPLFELESDCSLASTPLADQDSLFDINPLSPLPSSSLSQASTPLPGVKSGISNRKRVIASEVIDLDPPHKRLSPKTGAVSRVSSTGQHQGLSQLEYSDLITLGSKIPMSFQELTRTHVY